MQWKSVIDTIVALKDGRFFISDIERNILAVTNDDKKIKSLLDEVTDLPEHILSLIVNNKNLAESVRNKAFDMGCNWELISNYTRHIAQEMYPNIIIHPFNDIDSLHIKDETEKKKLKQFSKMTLCRLIEQGVLSDEHKQDLLNRIRFENPEMMSSIGDIFCTECMYENDMEVLGRIVSMLEFDIKWPRGYESILLSNDFFCDSTDYHKITTFYVNSYICEKGIVDETPLPNPKIWKVVSLTVETVRRFHLPLLLLRRYILLFINILDILNN